jgi:neuronal PAS domain-containing protein 1/3
VDYHNAMTPPSSVSPRDNSINNNNSNKPSITLQSSTSLFEYSSEALRGQYGPESGSMHQLPLKPQPYSAAVMHHNPIEAAYSSLDQAQFFPHHSGFHLYKNSTSAGWGV